MEHLEASGGLSFPAAITSLDSELRDATMQKLFPFAKLRKKGATRFPVAPLLSQLHYEFPFGGRVFHMLNSNMD